MTYRPMQLKDELKYLRREGNRLVRSRRRRRTAFRVSLLVAMWTVVAAVTTSAGILGVRMASSPSRFKLAQVLVRGTREAGEIEVRDLVGEWMGRNIFTIALTEVEKKVREHPWIGASGGVRVQRRLPGALVITVRERTAAGCALVGGVIYLLDEKGMPIDRYGPRYGQYDFPIIKGLDGMRASMNKTPGMEVRLRDALLAGVEVTRTLAEREPAFYPQVSEIDVSDPDMVVLRLEGEAYDLRLSREDCLRNLERYVALRSEMNDDGHDIEYVDLRWRDRIAVMPAIMVVDQDGGK